MSKDILKRFNNLALEYKGKIYSNINNINLFSNDIENLITEELPVHVSDVFEYDETTDDFILSFYNVFVNIESEKLKIYSEKCNEITYNKSSQKSIGEKIISLDSLDKESKINMSICLDKIIRLNDNVNNYLIAEAKKFNLINCDDTGNLNFTNLCLFNTLEFEKLINSKNTKLLINNLEKTTFEISEANKLHKVVGLPKFAIQMIKAAKLEAYIDELKKISDELDGNSFKIFLEFMTNSKLLINVSTNKYNMETKLNEYLKDIATLLQNKYRIIDLLNYLLRQSMFYSAERKFRFPFSEANLLKDYINMCANSGLTYEKYPSQLKRTHDIVSKNINTLMEISEEVEEKFEVATILYSEVEKTIEVKNVKNPEKTMKFIFKVPQSIREIIQEGNDLHHCIGSYGNKIINGDACIVFMRNADAPNESFITINIDNKYNLIEAKKNFNEEPETEYLQIIDKWLKELKK